MNADKLATIEEAKAWVKEHRASECYQALLDGAAAQREVQELRRLLREGVATGWHGSLKLAVEAAERTGAVLVVLSPAAGRRLLDEITTVVHFETAPSTVVETPAAVHFETNTERDGRD